MSPHCASEYTYKDRVLYRGALGSLESGLARQVSVVAIVMQPDYYSTRKDFIIVPSGKLRSIASSTIVTVATASHSCSGYVIKSMINSTSCMHDDLLSRNDGDFIKRTISMQASDSLQLALSYGVCTAYMCST